MGEDSVSRMLRTKQKHQRIWTRDCLDSKRRTREGSVWSVRQGATHLAAKPSGVDWGYEREGAGSAAGGGRCLAEESGKGSEVGPDISEEDEGLGAGLSVDGESFEAPTLEGGVAALGSVACTVVELFPGWGTEGDVADKATRCVGVEGEANVEDLTVFGVRVQMRALSG